MINTLILEPKNYSNTAIEYYKKLGNVHFINCPNLNTKLIDILVIKLNYIINEKFLNNYPNIKIIATSTTGLNHIDLEFCKKNKIKVISLNNINYSIKKISSTSELTIGLIICLIRNIIPASEDVKVNGNWRRYKFTGRQLTDLSIGIIGLGRIGQHLANYSKSFGMQVFAFDPYVEDKVFKDLKVRRLTKEKILSTSDIISINVNYSPSNENLIGLKEIAKMKTGSYLINTSRGDLVDEEAVVKGLKTKKLYGFATDVIKNEHNFKHLITSPLINAAREGENIIITPHLGGCTKEAMELTEEFLAKHIYNLKK